MNNSSGYPSQEQKTYLKDVDRLLLSRAIADTVHAVWLRNPQNYALSYRNVGGPIESGVINLHAETEQQYSPAIATEGNSVYIVWSARVRPGHPGDESIRTLFRRSTNDGSTFDATYVINPYAGQGQWHQPSIAAGANNVYVVWSDSADTEPMIGVKRSTDRGTTFELLWRSLSEHPTHDQTSAIPQIATTGSNVYVAWRDYLPPHTVLILYRRSVNHGTTYEPTTVLSTITPAGYNWPTIAATGSNVYVVWDAGRDIYLRRSTDGGRTFGATNLVHIGAGLRSGPKVAALGNTVYLAWFNFNQIYYRRSLDGGNSFEPARIVVNGTNPWDMEIAITASNLFIVWTERTGDHSILVKSSVDDFSRTTNLSSITGLGGAFPAIATTAT
jgi:hypothetical protein